MSHRPCSLVLAAHGSLAADNCNQPLHDLAESIESAQRRFSGQQRTFDRVTPAFLNGEPEMTQVLEALPSGDVVVVPVMTSDGYYLRKLQSKFEENRNFNEFRIVVTPVIGLHPSIPRRIGKRISHWLTELELQPEQTTAVVVGHGTRRNATSGRATIALTESLRQQFPKLKFASAFLDQDPTAESVAAEITSNNTLIIPFLISRGPHSTEDIPEAFGLPSGLQIEFPLIQPSESGIRICDLPVGMYPDMAEVCLELALEAIPESEPVSALAPEGNRP